VSLGIAGGATETAIALAPVLPVRSPEVEQLIGKLLVDRTRHDALLHAIRTERVLSLDTASEMMDALNNLPVGYRRNRWVRAQYLSDTILLFEDASEALRTAALNDWPTFKRDFIPYQQQIANELEQRPEGRVIAAELLIAYDRIVQTHYRSRAARRLAAAALAVRWYALEHDGTLPATLDKLVPDYLPHVPEDPFDPAGSSIRYVSDPNRPILYSVGDDGIDHGGSEADRYRPERPARSRWAAQDLVVHLILQPPREEPGEFDIEDLDEETRRMIEQFLEQLEAEHEAR
jgi:hypothetical protein